MGCGPGIDREFCARAALGLGVLHFFPLDLPFKEGLFLVAAAGGAAFSIKMVELAGKGVLLATSMLLILLPTTAIYMPFVVPLLMPEAEVNALEIGMPLLWMLILPLGAGLAVSSLWPRVAARVQPIMQRTSSVALVVLTLALFIISFGAFIRIFGEGVITAALLILGGAYVAGYVLGGEDRDTRLVFGLSTAQRNYAAALVVASQALGEPAAVVTALVSMVLLFAIAWIVRARHEKRTPILRRVAPISTYRLPG